MFAEITKRSFIFARTGTRVERGLLGADAGLYGAAYLPFQCERAFSYQPKAFSGQRSAISNQ
jgi:glucokinase